MEPTAIYCDRYVDTYRSLYIDHPFWQAKHNFNLSMIRSLVGPKDTWLDTCCGQAWHFQQMAGTGVEMVGIDISRAQLASASKACPEASFVCADVSTHDFVDRRFDLVTNFWGAYGYLNNEEAIASLLGKLVRWTRPGGSLYMELISPEALAFFGATTFAQSHSTEVIPRTGNFVQWSYVDPGGEHELTSPPHRDFLDLLSPCFEEVDSGTVVSTIRQLVARGKRRECVVEEPSGSRSARRMRRSMPIRVARLVEPPE